MLPREALEVLTEAQELPVGGGFGVAVGEVCLRASEDNVEDFTVTALFIILYMLLSQKDAQAIDLCAGTGL